jgi:CheY-like chemotaxis protein
MRILVIHDSQTIQRILQGYFITEFSEAAVQTATSGAALERLTGQTFDLVLCGNEMEALDACALKRVLAGTRNQATPLLVLVFNPSPSKLRRFSEHGLEHILQPPFSPAELVRVVQSLYNPRAYRTQDRFSIPGNTALLWLAEHDISGVVVNISAGGMLCDHPLPDSGGDLGALFRDPLVSLNFPPVMGAAQVVGIRAQVMRLQVTAWINAIQARHVRTAWRFLDMPEPAREGLVQALKQAKAQQPHWLCS